MDGMKQSVTDYLDEKARKDHIEHVKEKMAETKRVEQKYGGRPVAMRYMIGDPIPANAAIFYCPYCRAENLVERGYRIGSRNCYFCRTQLK